MNHNCENNIENNMSEPHCRVCMVPLLKEESTDWAERFSYEIGLIFPLETDGLFEFLDKVIPLVKSELERERQKAREELIKEILEKAEHKFYGANNPKVIDILEFIKIISKQ